MINTKRGDLLNAEETVIVHQVNCFGAAGGLAAAVFRKYPAAEKDYLQLIERMDGSGLLGIVQFTGQQKDGHIIANLFGQYYPGADYRPYALKRALRELGEMARTMEWSVAIPYKLSCGICGGDWNEVQDIIKQTMRGVNVTIYQREGDE